MSVKFACVGIAVAAALAIGAPAFAADNDTGAPAKPVHHHTMHHKATHHAAEHHAMHHKMHHEMHHAAAHHDMHMHHGHGAMGVEAKERAETARLNQQQLTDPGK